MDMKVQSSSCLYLYFCLATAIGDAIPKCKGVAPLADDPTMREGFVEAYKGKEDGWQSNLCNNSYKVRRLLISQFCHHTVNSVCHTQAKDGFLEVTIGQKPQPWWQLFHIGVDMKS
ncbi:hypothetical protein BTVI_27183 [Pitangus sulphuratus]|nr:hypothetical protein BTVI_27183 [Pitangus sulphuratus]